MRSPRVCVPWSFWMMKLASGSPGTTRIRFESRGLGTLIRLPAEKPGSSRSPYCAPAPPWQPDTAQLTVKTLSWMEASVGGSPVGGDTMGCPFWSSPSPLPAPQAARASATIAIAARTRNRSGRVLLLDCDITADLPSPAVHGGSAEVIAAVNVEVEIVREEGGHVRRGNLGSH